MNDILWIERSGTHCHDIPERCGPWKTVYARFKKWDEGQVFEEIFTIILYLFRSKNMIL